jgi:hypothetical protein
MNRPLLVSESRTQPPKKTAERIKTLDKQLTTAWSGYVRNRFELGRILQELQELLRGQFRAHLANRNFARSTAYDLLADYDRVKDLPAIILEMAEAIGIDIAASRYGTYIEANRSRLKEPVTKAAATAFLAGIQNAGKRAAPGTTPASLNKYERRRHDAFRSLVALGDRPDANGDIVQEFKEIVSAAAYQLGIDKRVVIDPSDGPRWLTEGFKEVTETVA